MKTNQLLRAILITWVTGTSISTTAASESSMPEFNDIDLVEGAYDCLVEPRTLINIGSLMQGIVDKVLVQRGTSVSKGQTLVQMEASMDAISVEQAKARATMHSEINSREADLALAKSDFKRFSQLHADSLVSDQQRDEAQARQQIAESTLIQAIENRMLVLLDLKRAQQQLNLRTIRSPVDGVVVKQLVFAGEYISDNPLLTIAELDPLRIEAVLPGRMFGSITKDSVVSVYLETGNGEAVPAQIDIIDPLFDARSGTFGVRLILPNPEFEIPAGQKCRVRFDVSDVDKSYLVPASRAKTIDSIIRQLGAANPTEAPHVRDF